MVAFLDIEGAFNKIQHQAILNKLDHLGVQPLLKSVIDQLHLLVLMILHLESLRQHWLPKLS